MDADYVDHGQNVIEVHAHQEYVQEQAGARVADLENRRDAALAKLE